MAPQKIYTLGDFESRDSRTLQNSPAAYKKITDSPYTFVGQDLAEVITPAASNLLQVAYWSFKANNIPVYGSISPNGSTVTFLYSKKGEGLTDAGESYSVGSKSNIQAYLPPFKYIAPRNWPKNSVRKEEARTQARRQLILAIKLAFLVTGRIKKITSDETVDLFLTFDQLCNRMLDADDDETDQDTESDVAFPSGPSAKVLGKRRVIDTSSEDEYTEQYGRLSLEPGKRRKSSRLEGGDISPLFGLGEAPPEPSEKMKKLVAAMTEQAVAEALNNQDEDKREAEKKIKSLEKELANQKKEARDWKMKYTTLQTDVQKAHEALGKIQK